MALGYQVDNIAPGLLMNAGNSMVQSIRNVGQQIRADVIRNQTDQQVVGLLTEAQRIDPNSPTFQNDLVGVLAKYPMAGQDERAAFGIGLLSKAWQQKRAEAEAETQFINQSALYRLKHPNAGRMYGDDDSLPLPTNQDPLAGNYPEQAQADPAMEFGAGQRGGVFGRFGLGIGNGTSFGAGMNDLGVGFTPPPQEEGEASVLPPLPGQDQLPPALRGGPSDPYNPVLAFRKSQKGRIPAEVGQREEARLAADYEREKMRRETSAQKPVYRSGTNDVVSIQPDGSSKVIFKVPPKTKGVFVTQEGNPVVLLTDGKWQYPDGSIHDEAPEEGIKRIPGFTEQDRSDESKRKNEAAESRLEKVDVLKNLRDERDERQVLRRDYIRLKAKASSDQEKREFDASIDRLNRDIDLLNSRIDSISAEADAAEAFKDEAEARAAGKKSGESVLAPKDAEALNWARQNPSDPRSARILQRLGVQ